MATDAARQEICILQSYGAELVLEQSRRKIAYSRLRAKDAKGRELPARIGVIESKSEIGKPKSEIALVVNDAEAVYPVRIDPTFSDANWISLGGFPGAGGWVLAAAVDVSGNLYIGVSFNPVGEVIANNVATWNGSRWSAVGSGMGAGIGVLAEVSALAVSGNTLYAGGGCNVERSRMRRAIH